MATARSVAGISSTEREETVKHALLPLASALAICVAATVWAAGLTAEVQNKNDPKSPRTAAAIYTKSCATCHGNDGRSKTLKGKLKSARNLTDPQWQADVSDERIFNSISNGRGKMPSYGKKLSEAEIDSLVSYVRGLKK